MGIFGTLTCRYRALIPWMPGLMCVGQRLVVDNYKRLVTVLRLSQVKQDEQEKE
ncbi:hypothetical protein CIFRMM251M_26435 [Citrobacter freundii]|jgi:hypothetical protein|uniref:Uncharacterized protein n=1 Tax=Enterobacter hormaechei subsp. xiangfangensis TaxID=1296536 RepID=A0A5S9LX42_9ENTR|nr:hypothetical protein AI2661V1_5215 [Citrobacter freundii]SAQ65061.1 Uncharacterised protein [Klebsiella michiganensis]SLS84965.1 Uncharacterised protein [Klebsiella pneumoniae]BBP50125.1 hypothetical protein [Enterobacter hormaechei subsp. xiangfangensis]CAH4027885.1 hypothetical protein AI2661V1_5215 [Citrobacter freundii]